MKKRFTDTEKWGDAWFMDLPAKWKLFWLFLCDNCDNAGVWEPNFRLASFQIGDHFDQGEAMRLFSHRITVLENGNWHITKFVDFQYGSLSETCAPHRQVLKLLEKHGIERVAIPLAKGKATLLERVKDIDKDKDKETGKRKGSESECKAYAQERGLPESDGEWFFNSMEAGGWTRGGKPLKDWKAHFRSYAQQKWLPSLKGQTPADDTKPKTGDTRVNPQTGKKEKFLCGQWGETI